MKTQGKKTDSLLDFGITCLTTEKLRHRITQRRERNRATMNMTFSDDAKAIQSDWQNIGLDIMSSISRVANEQ